MERKEVMTVGDVLRECLEKSSMQEHLDEMKACEVFASVVGPSLAGLCRKPTMRSGLMTVGTSNASLRSELNMRRGALKKAINEILGEEIVKEIVFRC